MHTQNTHTDRKPEEISSSKNADASVLQSETNDKLPRFYRRTKQLFNERRCFRAWVQNQCYSSSILQNNKKRTRQTHTRAQTLNIPVATLAITQFFSGWLTIYLDAGSSAFPQLLRGEKHRRMRIKHKNTHFAESCSDQQLLAYKCERTCQQLSANANAIGLDASKFSSAPWGKSGG